MAVTPNPSRKLGFSLPPTPAPFLTPRPERRPFDLRWADGSSSCNRHDRDKEVNVQVVLRCRPLNEEEQKLNVQQAISCNEQKKEVIVLQSVFGKQLNKMFTFDKVFGPKAQQRSVYDHAISPIINDVLEGYNCTVFAYGQTGTGKTYTMEGGMTPKVGNLPADAGVIPRSVRHIFEILEARKADYSMKVTFMELYNEEITDLLAPEDHTRIAEDRQRRPISLMEDGKGGAVIRGLEEVVVYSSQEIYGLLERGSAKRRTADTLLNKQSSRSHSVFSITIHVKEPAVGNEELVKCGRLNLVDLAGSENICRSGAREVRAREAGEMNKSLLTLGRVITALVEHSSHIPYRDSKLTRLLRESLGGKAKTCIIATVSPSVYCLEETLSTLDYAYRAKNIKNKPEANQKCSKSVLLKDVYLEIERMKQDVRAAREKNGIYIPQERFAEDEAEKKAMIEKIETLEFDMNETRKQADKFKDLYNGEHERNLDLERDLSDCKMSLEESKRALVDLQDIQARTTLMLKEKDFIISSLLNSEHSLLHRAKELHSGLECASGDISNLLAKVERQSQVENSNHHRVFKLGSHLDRSLKDLHEIVVGTVCAHHDSLRSMEEHVNSFMHTKSEVAKCLEMRIERIKDVYTSGILHMRELSSRIEHKASSDFEDMKQTTSAHLLTVENFLVVAVSEAEQVLDDVQRLLSEQRDLLAFSAQKQEEGLRRSLVSTQVMSKATSNFFVNLHNLASRLTTFVEENHINTSHRLSNFERTFKELSAKEEKKTLEKVTEILANLKTTKQEMVSEILQDLHNTCTEQAREIQKEMSDMKLLSDNAEREWTTYVTKVENQVQDDITCNSRTETGMTKILEHCFVNVAQSLDHLKNMQSSIDHQNDSYSSEINFTLDHKNNENRNLLEELVKFSSECDGKFDSATHDLEATVKKSLLMDHDAGKEVKLLSNICLDHLQRLHDNHVVCIEEITSLADKCLEECTIDHPTGSTPTKQTIEVPSLASVEELSAPVSELVMQHKLDNRLGNTETKHHLAKQTARSPLTTINI